MKLSSAIYQFFALYLPQIKGSSDQTVKAYRDAFSVFVPFAANYLSTKVNAITIDHLSGQYRQGILWRLSLLFYAL